MSSRAVPEKAYSSLCSLLHPASSVLAAVSGGSDSTALLILLCDLRKKLLIRRLGVLHVNHGLRGAESDNDERFVKKLAAQFAVPFYVKRLRGVSPATAGMESWARRERYAFFLDVLNREGFDAVATGHTADDQAETVLQRIIRGASLRGLRGIIRHRDDGVIRPLLGVRRQELIRWLTARGIPFCTDSSNTNLAFQRNRIRQVTLPSLETKERKAFSKMIAISRKAAALWLFLKPAIDRWIDAYTIRSNHGFSVMKTGLHDEFHASEALRTLFELYGIEADSHHIEVILASRKRSSGTLLLPGGRWRFYPLKNRIVFRKTEDARSRPFAYFLKIPGTTLCGDHGACFSAQETTVLNQEIPHDNYTVALDKKTCGKRLIYRSWRSDDLFDPFGSDSLTAVKTFLSKQKMPRFERSRCGVVTGMGGRIIWIPGVRIGNSARITSQTSGIVKISYIPAPE
ncbi:MAG: tRNA lysidine(34) synthetase TilS [Chitinispirillaceae bacterium]|nr:tRNA lysidine(34) synthetase TilS [Chitinispirillaceae bacterium]